MTVTWDKLNNTRSMMGKLLTLKVIILKYGDECHVFLVHNENL